MSSEELPAFLKLLRDDLDTAGPAEYRTPKQEQALSDAAIDEAAEQALVHVRRPWLSRFAMAAVVVLGASAAAAWAGGAFTVEPAETDEPRSTHQASSPVLPEVVERAATEEAQPEPESEASARSIPPSQALAPKPRAASPQSPSDMLAAANRLRAAGKNAEAQQAYSRVIEQQSGTSAAYVARVSLAQLRAAKPSAAIELLLAARRQQPAGVLQLEIASALAKAHRASGNHAQERAELQRIVKLQPNGPAARQARQRLQVLKVAP